ncbi:MAG: hypothetical protein ACRD4X_17185 [Candidatus Acidiferrales bacterium]
MPTRVYSPAADIRKAPSLQEMIQSESQAMRLLASIALALLLVPVACAQSRTIAVPGIRSVKLSGSIAAFASKGPDVVLTAKGKGARPGRLWIRNAGDGLLIAGEIDGGPPNFPRDQKSLVAKDHLEVWLAAGVDPIFPAIGWGNQFGETQLPDGSASCTNPDSEEGSSMFQPNSPKSLRACRAWAAKQQTYRRYFRRLFLRQWLLAPGYAAESFATSAYQQISSTFAGLYDGSIDDDSPDALKPRGAAKSWFSTSPKGYTFEVLIPYNIFPPLASLQVSDLRLLVDVFSAAPAGKKSGPYSTSSPARIWADPATFNHLVLNLPRVFHMTPCDLPLTGLDVYGTVRDAWFVPQSSRANSYQSDAFLIFNEAGGNWYDPTGLSPIAHPVHNFWTAAGPGEWVCGPQLTHTKNGGSVTFGQRIESDGLATRRLPDGSLLVKSGPYVDAVSQFGAGQCGTCSYTNLEIFRITPDDKIESVLKLGNTLMGIPPYPVEEDFSISPDWSQITDFQESVDSNGNSGPWSSATYCLQDARYAECGKQDDVKAPNSPLLREER